MGHNFTFTGDDSSKHHSMKSKFPSKTECSSHSTRLLEPLPKKKNQDSVTPNVWIKHPAVVAGPRSWASPREPSFTHKWVLWRLKQRNCSQVASSKLDINQITELSNARLTVFYSMGEGSRHCCVCLGNYRNHIPEKYTNSLLFIEQP